MNLIRWPGLLRRIRGRVVIDLYYDPQDGAVWVIFEGGRALRIEADWEGCSVVGKESMDSSEHPGSLLDVGLE